MPQNEHIELHRKRHGYRLDFINAGCLKKQTMKTTPNK